MNILNALLCIYIKMKYICGRLKIILNESSSLESLDF